MTTSTDRATTARSTAGVTGRRRAADAGAGKPGAPKTRGERPATGNASADADLRELGGRVISVHGPFGARTMIDLPTTVAEQFFGGDLVAAAPSEVLDAVARDVAAIRDRDEALGESALAAAAFALAREIASPFNSATSKSMCARELREHLDRLRALLPPEETSDGIDELSAAREGRRARAAGGAEA